MFLLVAVTHRGSVNFILVRESVAVGVSPLENIPTVGII